MIIRSYNLSPVAFRARMAFTAALLLGCLTATSPANAQALLPHFALHAGAYLPQSSGVKKVGGSTWLDFGADITLPVGVPLVGSSHIQLDYITSSRSHIIPLVFVQTLQPSAVVARSPAYAGFGFGFWNVSTSSGANGTAPGFRLLAGLDLGPHFYLEARYDNVSRIRHLRLDGYTITAGIHF